MISLDSPFDRALRASHLSLEKATATANWVPHIWWSSQKQRLQPKFQIQIPDSEIIILAKRIPPSSNLYCVVYKAFSVLIACGYKTIIQRSYICVYFVFQTSPQFSSVAQSCPTLCEPMNRSTPGLPVHHQLPEFIQTHVHQVSDAIQPSHPLSSPSPLAPNPSQHQSLFQWVNSSHEVAMV